MLNRFIDDFYDVLFKPARGMERVVAERTVWHGLAVYLAVSLVSTLTALATADPDIIGHDLGRFWPQETVTLILRSSPVLGLITILIFAPLLLFAWSAILQFSAELVGGRGRGLQLAAAVGYAQLPYLLVAPFTLLAVYTAFDLTGMATFAAFIWSVVLKTEAIRAAHLVSRGRAVLAYFLPVLLVLLAAVVFVLLAGAFLMPLLSRLFPLG